MTVSLKTNHLEEALDNRIEQFKNKPKFESLLTPYINQIQNIENALLQIKTETTLDSSVGQQLDNIGEIVGEERFGRSDLQYKTALSARIQLNTSEGTIEQIIELIRGIAGDVQVRVTEFYPAAFVAQIIDPIDPTQVDVTRISTFVAGGRAAGVGGITTFGVTGSFQFDSGLGYDLGKYGGAELS